MTRAVFCGDAVHAFPIMARARAVCQISFLNFWTSVSAIRTGVIKEQFDFCRRALYGTAKLKPSFLLTLHAGPGNHSVSRRFLIFTVFAWAQEHQRASHRHRHRSSGSGSYGCQGDRDQPWYQCEDMELQLDRWQGELPGARRSNRFVHGHDPENRGFSKATTEAHRTSPSSQALRIDVHMKVGAALTRWWTCNRRLQQVETVNPTIGGTVTDRAIPNLPLNGRNTLDLQLAQPGVIPIADDIGTYGTSNCRITETGLGGISVAGGRGDAITYLLDGGMNNRTTSNRVVFEIPNPEAVQEFRLPENNYTAEYGRNGGGTINVVDQVRGPTPCTEAYSNTCAMMRWMPTTSSITKSGSRSPGA